MVVVAMEVMVTMVTGVWMTVAMEGHGESVVSDVPMPQARVEGWVGGGVDVSFTSGNSKCLQHVENNLAFYSK